MVESSTEKCREDKQKKWFVGEPVEIEGINQPSIAQLNSLITLFSSLFFREDDLDVTDPVVQCRL